MPHFSRQTIAIIAMMLIIIVPAAANASDHDTEETKTAPTTWEPRLSFWFDDDLGILVFGPTDPTAEEALDCTPTGDPLTVDEDGMVVGEIPEGCTSVVIEGGEEGISHGDVVSQIVRALKEIRGELHGPFGQYVREIATSDLGKPEKSMDTDGAEDGDDHEGHGPPDHAVARGHDKDHPSGDDTENSDTDGGDHGPPDHAKAHGRNK